MNIKINTTKIFLIASFVIPFILFLTYNLNHFYDHGGYTLDDGWFAYLATNSTSFPIKNPNMIGGTYFSVHISPFFYILTLPYMLLNNIISEVTYFSIYLAMINALLSFAVFNISTIVIKSNKIIYLIISILTALNGVVLSSIGFPHIELAIPILIILFLSLYFTDHKKLSYLTIFFLLLIREDSGFHLFSVLFLLSVSLFFITKRRDYSLSILKIALVGLAYSIIAVLVQKMYFPSDTLERVYLGTPHFAHFTKDFFIARIDFLLHNKEYLYIPAFATLILSLVYKNLLLTIGLIAILPWVLLSFVAVSFQAGGLVSYYAFPFILLVSWPPIAFALQYKINQKINHMSYFISIFLITGTSILLFPNNAGSHDPSPWETIGFNFLTNINNTDKFINYISMNTDGLYTDDHISSLMTKNLIYNLTWMGCNVNASNYFNKNVTSIAFYNESGSAAIKGIALNKNLKYIYSVPNSKILLASRNNLLETNFLKRYPNGLLFWEGKDLPSQTGTKKDTIVISKAGIDKAGYITFGPYIPLPIGTYEFKITYSSNQKLDTKVGKWDVGRAIPTGMNPYDQGLLHGTNNKDGYIIKTFVIPKEYSNEKVEIRNYYNGVGNLTIKNLTITRVQ